MSDVLNKIKNKLVTPKHFVVIFSKDRASQLDLLIRSIKSCFRDYSKYQIYILYAHSDDSYRTGYRRVRELHPEFKYVKESDFKVNLVEIFEKNKNMKTVSFFTDDDVFTRGFKLHSDSVYLKFLENEEIYTVSLRLGVNITYSYNRGVSMNQPVFDDENKWEWKFSEIDWKYPMSVDGNIFRYEDVYPLVKGLDYFNPNSFERTLAYKGSKSDRKYMICSKKSKVVNISVNRVQNTIPNAHADSYDAKYLNDLFLDGKRIKYNMYKMSNNSVHIAFNFEFEEFDVNVGKTGNKKDKGAEYVLDDNSNNIMILTFFPEDGRKGGHYTFAMRVKNHFLSKGYNVFLASNKKEARKIIKEHSIKRVISTFPYSTLWLAPLKVEHFSTDHYIPDHFVRKAMKNAAYVSKFYVFSAEFAQHLVDKFNFSSSDIVQTELLPVDIHYLSGYSQLEEKQKLGLDVTKIQIIVFGGSAGANVYDISTTISTYLNQEGLYNVEILAFTGHNSDDYNRLKNISNVRVFKQIPQEEYLSYVKAADLLILRPGGGVTSELIALGKPALFYTDPDRYKFRNSVAYHEFFNNYMVRKHLGYGNENLVPGNKPRRIIPYLQYFLKNRDSILKKCYKNRTANTQIWDKL